MAETAGNAHVNPSRSHTTSRRTPELLAPVGNRDCLQAAIENGADAVYFGLQHGFNARFRAGNFTLEEVSEVMRTLHRRRVKGYVTLNTLAFPHELSVVEETLRQLAVADVDAILVQDLGVARLARAICPDLPLHASTQMTLTCRGAIDVARQLGISRVVLPREASLDDLRRTREETDLPLEVFVHGALCVAYSGQCLTSESLGGRSANRGQCAQACRLPYELVCDGQDRDLGPQRYLLSPQDLAAWRLIPDLVRLGIDSFKIEGRLKTPEYVAAVTAHYRRAVDAAISGTSEAFSDEDLFALEQTFSRGFSHGWMAGCDHKALVPGLSSAKRGVFLGTIRKVDRGRVHIQLAAPLAAGDGIAFEGDRMQGKDQGGRVFAVYQQRRLLDEPLRDGVAEVQMMHGSIHFDQLRVGQHVWKTDDPRLTRQLRATFTSTTPRRRIPIDLQINARVGDVLRVTVPLDHREPLCLSSPEPLVEATKHPLTEAVLREQFERLGRTIYQLRNLQATIEGRPMVPLSVLGQMRRQIIEALDASFEPSSLRTVACNVSPLVTLRAADESAARLIDASTPETPQLWVLCRDLKQIPAVLQQHPDGIYVDLHDIRAYRQVAELMQGSSVPWWIATLRVQLPAETGLLRVLQRHAPAGFLVRHLAALEYYRVLNVPVVADFSLNAANDLTVHWLLQQGVQRVTASYDLNREQLMELMSAVPTSRMETVIHQHMPMFHMQHCVFCSVLSPGTNKTNCGRPCDNHVVHLRDHVGKQHRLEADVGCRNTLFNGTPQSGAEAVPDLLAAGVRHFRLELLEHTAEEISRLIPLYRQLLQGEISPQKVWSTLRAANRVGVTRGTLEDRPELV